MSTTARVSLDDYLSTHYEPECELIGGELIKKTIGTEDHGDVQSSLLVALRRLLKGTKFKASTEVSFRHGTDVRIPDVSVYRRGASLYRGVLDEPPILCIEVVSPSQRPNELFAKCDAYHSWGVPFCWIVDPVKESAWEHHANMPLQVVAGTLRAGDIELTIAEVFEES